MNWPDQATPSDEAPSQRTARHVYACDFDWDTALGDELRRALPRSQHVSVSAGWLQTLLESAEACDAPTIAFARQCLPNAQDVEAASISQWVERLGTAAISLLKEHAGPWRWHLFSHYATDAAAGPRRCGLIQQGLDQLWQKKQRRIVRTRQLDLNEPWQSGEALLQAALLSPTHGILSCCLPDERLRLRRVVSRFPGGDVTVARDPQAPSRAFAKLVEAQLRLGTRIEPGQSCIDLGSSPGGWAYVALAQGAHVLAIDRSPLREDLMQHPRLTFLQTDAFKYLPDAPIDWLLSDVVAFPPRIVELLDRWLSRRLCRRFCVTIKFRGADDYPQLEDVKRLLSAHDVDYCLRRLSSNRNEVTAYGMQINQTAPGETARLVGC